MKVLKFRPSNDDFQSWVQYSKTDAGQRYLAVVTRLHASGVGNERQWFTYNAKCQDSAQKEGAD